MYAYIGLAAWESCLPALPGALSLGQKLEGLRLPEHPDKNNFLAAAALNSAYAAMTRHFFPHAPRALQQRCRSLAERYAKLFRENYPVEAVAVSENLGRATADSVFLWSAADTIGHEAYLYNFDRKYQPDSSPGKWSISIENPMPPLLPHWGEARTFIVSPGECPTRPPVVFSEKTGSDFFAQAMEVYSISMPMTEEKRWIAEFWSDDAPGVSICAATRWVSIALQSLQKSEVDLSLTLETLLKVGLALHDTGVKIWQEKYAFSVERPESYIRRNIAPNWSPLHEAPPFPAYPSGHAGFGAAAAVVLERQLSNAVPLTDRTHEGRKEFLGKPRRFNSYQEMARENAVSRLYLGVHYRMDAEEGMRIGTWLGNKIAALPLYDGDLSTRD